MSPSRTVTGYVRAGITAGSPVTWPVRTSKREPCRGHSTDISQSSPSQSEYSSCVQVSEMAWKLSSSAWIRQIGVPSTSTRFIDSFGSSLVEATRSRVTLFNPRGQFLLDRLTYLRNRQPVENFAEEALDQHPLGDRSRDAAAHEVEEVLRIDRSDGRAVTAPQDVVVEDLEDWLGGRLGLFREQKIAIRLVRRTPSSCFLDPHHAHVDTLGAVLETALEQQVRPGMRRDMVLQRAEVEGLLAGAEAEPPQVRRGPS